MRENNFSFDSHHIFYDGENQFLYGIHSFGISINYMNNPDKEDDLMFFMKFVNRDLKRF